MAVVYAATHDDGTVAAVKILHRDAVDPVDHDRFRREYQVLSRIRHPNVVRVDGLETWGGWPVLSMELIDGEDLDAVIKRWKAERPPDRFEVVERMLRELCLALEAIHGLGLVHRDIKPANVLVSREGTVKLTDFGVVKQVEAPSLLTQAGRLVGTIAYMAPELISEEAVDARTDLYGLGAVLYSLLTLRRPVQADSVAGYLAQNLSERPPPPHEIDPAVPERLERVCMRLLEKHPDMRFPSARAVLNELDGAHGVVLSLHGRDEPLRGWMERLAALRHGQGSVVWLVGERGSGRTALLEVMLDHARAAGMSVGLLQDHRQASVLAADGMDAMDATVRERAEERRNAVASGQPLALILLQDRPPHEVGEVDIVYRLGPLPPRALTALLRDAGVPTPVATALAARWADSPAGLPGAALLQVDALREAGWLVKAERGWLATRPLADFANEDLPPPAEVRADVTARLALLDDDARELTDLLALMGREVGATVLVRAMDRPVRGPAALETVIRAGLAVTDSGADDHVVRLAAPGIGAVIRGHLSPSVRAARHASLARVLARQRRRSSWSEIARHLDAAGLGEEAAAAWAEVAATGAPQEALAASERGIHSLGGVTAGPVRRRLLSTRGGALLRLGRVDDAMEAFDEAVRLATMLGDADALAGSLVDVGQARHRQGRFTDAIGPLEEAIALTSAGGPVQQRALRLRADVWMQQGDVARALELWTRSLDAAVARRDVDDEARARRGMAHCEAMRGRYGAAADALELADELLLPGGDPRVRAGVLARRVELEVTAGRAAFALPRVDVLVDLCVTRNLGARTALAWALAAWARQRVGQADAATDLARRAFQWARQDPAESWEALVLSARVLLDLGVHDAITGAVMEAELPTLPVYDPEGQLLALRARWAAVVQPTAARRWAREALARPVPHLGLARLTRALDAARALAEAGDRHAAREALADATSWVDPDRSDGALLEVALVRWAAGESGAGALELANRVAAPLHGRLREDFLARPDIRRLMDHG